MRKILACLLVVLLLAVTVSAQAPFVEDDSGLFSPAEIENLESQFSQLYEAYGFTVSVVTTPSLGGETPAQAAKNAYQANDYSNDGTLLFICPDEGQWYIYTSGMFSKAVPGNVLVQAGNSVKEDLQEGNHYDAAQAFCQLTTKPVIDAYNDDAAQTEQARRANGKFLVWGLLGGLVAGVAVAIALGKLAKKQFAAVKKPEAEAEPVPPVFEVEIPDIQSNKNP